MTYQQLTITDQVAAQLAGGPLPKEGHYRQVKLDDGRQAMLLRQKDRSPRGWSWTISIERELERPVKLTPVVKKQ